MLEMQCRAPVRLPHLLGALLFTLAVTHLTIAEPARPTLGILAITDAAASCADLLFAEFAASGAVELVERERLNAVFAEHELSCSQKGDAVEAGRLTRADALLFVDIVHDSLSVRLSETRRGERLYQYVFSKKDEALVQSCRAVVTHCAALISALTDANRRIYLAVRPTQMHAAAKNNTELLKKLRALLEGRLMGQDGIVLVERENLAAIADERGLGVVNTNVSAADYLVRSTATDAGDGKLEVELQLSSPAGDGNGRFKAAIDDRNMSEAIDYFTSGILQTLGRRSSVASNSCLHAEAGMQRYIAQLLLNARDYLGGVRCLETAYLLQPDHPGIREQLVYHICRYLNATANGVHAESLYHHLRSRREISKEAYLRYVRWLRLALDVARCDPGSTIHLLPDTGLKPLTFLTVRPKGLSADQALTIKALQTELRAYYEWYATFEGRRSKNPLDAVLPLCFDCPVEAFRFLKPSLTNSPYRPTRNHTFAWITYWDMQNAGNIWKDFLDELITSDSRSQQFEGLAGHCYWSGAFRSANLSPFRDDAQASTSTKRVLEWLEKDPQNLQWLVANEGWHTLLKIWLSLKRLSATEQDRFFGSVMIPMVECIPSEMKSACEYIKDRMHNAQTSDHTGSSVAAITRDLLSAMKIRHPALFARELEVLEQQDWYRELMHIQAVPNIERFLPVVKPGGIILFDSEKQHVSGTFEGVCMLREGNSLWICWNHVRSSTMPNKEDMRDVGIARMNLAAMNDPPAIFYYASKDGSQIGGGHFHPFRLARWHRFLLVAGMRNTLAIPLNAKQQPDFTGTRTLWPASGEQGVDSHHVVPVRRVSALIAGQHEVYVGMDDWYGDGLARNTYGGIFGWDPVTSKVRKLCSSDSLGHVPLNDCLPYQVIAGCPRSDGEKTCFFITGCPEQPDAFKLGQRYGVWEYTRSDDSWAQLEAVDFGFAGTSIILQPNPVSDDMLAFGTEVWNFSFDLEANRLNKLPRDVFSHPDAPHGWQYGQVNRDGIKYDEIFPSEATYRNAMPSLSSKRDQFMLLAALATEDGLLALFNRPGFIGIADREQRCILYFIPCEKNKQPVKGTH